MVYATVFASPIDGVPCPRRGSCKITGNVGRLIARQPLGIFGAPSIFRRRATQASRLCQLRLAMAAQGVGHDRVHELADVATEGGNLAHQRRGDERELLLHVMNTVSIV